VQPCSQSFLPVSLAWDIFGDKNGCATLVDFHSRILSYRARSGKTENDPTIGCLVLIEPFFFEQQDWIPVDSKEYHSIVVGKTMDTTSAAG
jgi:putative restriction endonuclease